MKKTIDEIVYFILNILGLITLGAAFTVYATFVMGLTIVKKLKGKGDDLR